MKTAATWFLGFAILVAVVWQPSQVAKAQNPALTPFQIVAGGAHTLCNIATGEYCFGTDGIWYSANGTTWTQIGVSSSITVAATAPLTATTSGSIVTLALPSAALKTAVDALGLQAAAAPVQ